MERGELRASLSQFNYRLKTLSDKTAGTSQLSWFRLARARIHVLFEMFSGAQMAAQAHQVEVV